VKPGEAAEDDERARVHDLWLRARQGCDSGKYEEAFPLLMLVANSRKTGECGQAQHRLGTLYEKGLGVPVDPVAAYAWYNMALRSGYRKDFDDALIEKALADVARVERTLTETQLAQAEDRYRSLQQERRRVAGHAAVPGKPSLVQRLARLFDSGRRR
jgi:TPR repeat protein